MAQKPAQELALIQVPSVPALDPDRKQTKAAIRRCCTAWERAYETYLEGTDRGSTIRIFAAHEAGPAYCRAMPPLAGYENIRDFIACAAHGILINAIPEKRANQLLYAAQVALASLHFDPKQRKS